MFIYTYTFGLVLCQNNSLHNCIKHIVLISMSLHNQMDGFNLGSSFHPSTYLWSCSSKFKWMDLILKSFSSIHIPLVLFSLLDVIPDMIIKTNCLLSIFLLNMQTFIPRLFPCLSCVGVLLFEWAAQLWLTWGEEGKGDSFKLWGRHFNQAEQKCILVSIWESWLEDLNKWIRYFE